MIGAYLLSTGDGAYDVVHGSDVTTARRVATVYYDRQDDGGLVLRWRVPYDAEAPPDDLPEHGTEAAELLMQGGYPLAGPDIALIDAMGRES